MSRGRMRRRGSHSGSRSQRTLQRIRTVTEAAAPEGAAGREEAEGRSWGGGSGSTAGSTDRRNPLR